MGLLHHGQLQLCLQFDEVIATPDMPELPEEQTETITYTRNKKGHGRKTLPKSLPYVEHIHDLLSDFLLYPV